MKKWISLLLVMATVLGLILVLPFSSAADSLCIKKIVSVVYDDSTSMTWDYSHDPYWPSANYALQAFCGMLNSEDQLFVTYMSSYESGSTQLELSADLIQDSVDSVREHSKTGGTPFGAVRTAFDKLKSVKDSDRNTQYWLVVITDGDYASETVQNGWDSSWDSNKKKEFLNNTFAEYTETEMPNGSTPQVTYLGIGNVVKPDVTESVHPYAAKNTNEILATMSEMADKISGRTRLQATDVKLINDDKTVSFTTSIPLANVAVFVQSSDAVVTGCHAESSTNKKVPLMRDAMLDFSEYNGKSYPELKATAFLLGDPQKVIAKGTYEVDFDTAVDIDNIVLLLEPALEVRMQITVNGKPIKDLTELDNLHENDVISVSCKVYEKGTDTEIKSDSIPGGTTFELTISEDGKKTANQAGANAKITDYILKNIKTELTASMCISGFNPIRTAVTFTPDVPRIVYQVTPSYGSDVRSVKFDDIASNDKLSICFAVTADGVTMTDPVAVKALNPKIEISPQGNTGVITYTDDGKIVFTPNAAKEPEKHDGSYKVTVTCTLEDGTAASQEYTVLLSEYKVIPVNADKSVKKTKLFQNDVGVSFYITKDGVKLGREEVQEDILVQLNKEHKNLKIKMTVAEDGTITVTPYSTKNDPLTFMKWHYNWKYYFSLEGEDIKVTFDHPYGTAVASIEIVEEDMSYLLLHVYLPLGLEILGAIILAIYIYCVVTKPTYLKSAKLYVGDIRYRDKGDGRAVHVISDFTAVELSKFNKLWGYGRLRCKKTASLVDAEGISIRADYGGRIICEMGEYMPWYKGKVIPKDSSLSNLKKPSDIEGYLANGGRKLEIAEFSTTETVEGDHNKKLAPVNLQAARYLVIADPSDPNQVKVLEDGRRVIKNGKIIIYVN